AAFGAVARPPVAIDPADYPLETPVRTAPAHGFVAAVSGARGLAVFAPGFFEYEWTPRGDLLVTLLRAVGELSRSDLPTRPGHAGWSVATPLAQCPGASRVELAVAPVSQAELERGDALPSLWEDAFLPLRGFWLRDAVELVPTPVDITLEGSGLVLSAVKPAQQGSPLVLRCYNATDRKAAGAWRFGESVKSAHRVLADGRRYLVAPEGLSRFYLSESPTERRVGASWMTREDRLAEIEDYVRYLDAVYADVFGFLDRALVTAHALGFSQGASTVSRWVALGKAKIDRLILWGGEFPPDLDLTLDTTVGRLRAARLALVYGRSDE